MAILNRRPKSGFVLYPKQANKRVVDGSARFRTRCDVLVGPCACGGVHQEDEPWVQGLLRDYDLSIEPFVLHLSASGVVKIPRYWVKPRQHRRCTVLHGPCSCGAVHTANERWVQELLLSHHAIVAIKIDSEIVDTDLPVEQPEEGNHTFCDCDACTASHARHDALDRRDI